MSVKTLFVGNISYSSTEEDLINHFAAYGATNCRIIEGRGFAFMDVDAEQCGAAIEALHNSELGGRKLNVDEARPRQGGGGGGGGGYGGDRRRY